MKALKSKLAERLLSDRDNARLLTQAASLAGYGEKNAVVAELADKSGKPMRIKVYCVSKT